MTHDDIYKALEEHLPTIAEITTDWFPYGKDSIRIRIITGSLIIKDLLFTYRDEGNWWFEEIGYPEVMKGENDVRAAYEKRS